MKLIIPLLSAAATTIMALPNPDGHEMEPMAEDMDMYNELYNKVDKLKENVGSIRQGDFTKKMVAEMKELMQEFADKKSEMMYEKMDENKEKMEEKMEMLQQMMMEYGDDMDHEEHGKRPGSPHGEGRPHTGTGHSPKGEGNRPHKGEGHDMKRPNMEHMMPGGQMPGGQIFVNGDMIINTGEHISFSGNGGAKHSPKKEGDHEKHHDMDHEKKEFDAMKFAERMYHGYKDYRTCMHTVKYMILKEVEGKSMEEVQNMVYGDMDHSSGMEDMENMDDMPMVRKRREGHEAHEGDHDMHHEDDFPMSSEDVDEYLQFKEEGNSISMYYMQHGEWLQHQWESMSPEEMAEATDYMTFIGSFLNEDTAMIHQYLVPYLDHMQYKFCVVKPTFMHAMHKQEKKEGDMMKDEYDH